MDDFLDNRDNISKRQHAIPPDKLKAGKLKGRIEIRLGDCHNTVVYCKPGKEDETRRRYREHLNIGV